MVAPSFVTSPPLLRLLISGIGTWRRGAILWPLNPIDRGFVLFSLLLMLQYRFGGALIDRSVDLCTSSNLILRYIAYFFFLECINVCCICISTPRWFLCVCFSVQCLAFFLLLSPPLSTTTSSFLEHSDPSLNLRSCSLLLGQFATLSYFLFPYFLCDCYLGTMFVFFLPPLYLSYFSCRYLCFFIITYDDREPQRCHFTTSLQHMSPAWLVGVWRLTFAFLLPPSTLLLIADSDFVWAIIFLALGPMVGFQSPKFRGLR